MSILLLKVSLACGISYPERIDFATGRGKAARSFPGSIFPQVSSVIRNGSLNFITIHGGTP